MFSKYYQSELAYLRDVGKVFSQANPTVAGFLAERGGDPDVARLLEGFAFLTARIRERIDDAVPEVLHGLAELLLPQSLRPIPATTIVELTPQLRSLRGRVLVPKGTQLGATPVEGTACLFRTTADLELLPVQVLESTFEGSALNPTLKVQLQTTVAGRPEIFAPQGLRLFIHGDLPVSSLLLLWLSRYCRGVSVSSQGQSPVRLPASAVRPCGFDPKDALFPDSGGLDAYRAVQELFALPQKFLFFEVKDLQAAQRVAADRFEITFEFERPPPMPARVGKDLLRVHCVPAVNLFQANAEPVRRDPLAHEAMLRAGGVDPLHMEIYTVDSVTGIRAGQSNRKQYPPFFAYAHAQQPPAEQAFYRLRRELSPVNDGIDTYLSIGTPGQTTPELAEETLSIELTCTNRSLPARLQLGDVSQPTATSPTVATFKNIVPVTKPVRPPLGSELHWRLVSHLALNHRSLGDAEALRAVLLQYNVQALADHPVGRANQLRIDAVRQVEMAPARRFVERAPVRGTRTVVQLEEAHFAGVGDAFLFGAVLDELFARNVTLNSFNELTVRLQPSNLELTWPPRSGTAPIL